MTAALPAKPSNTTAPAITGTAQQGDTLTASQGSWTGSPTGYAYQWQDCSSSCADISGATNSTYALVSGNVGDTIDVIVTATNAGGSTTATSAKTATVSAAPPGQAVQHCRSHDQRHRPTRPDADRRPRTVDRQPQLRLPVAVLLRHLLEHHRGDLLDLQPDRF